MVEELTSSNVTVVCRFRPLNSKEKETFPDQICVDFLPDHKSIIITPQSEHNDALQFKFDHIFTPECSQSTVFSISAQSSVDAVLQGFNSTIFAYGQTSSGKTYTMMGTSDPENQGIIPRMVSTIFSKINNSYSKIEFQVKLSYCEIYMEKIKDLLDPSKINLQIHEEKTRGVYIQNLTEQYVINEKEVFELMQIGNKNREVGCTDMNEGSSRSHSIFSLAITQTSLVDLSAKIGKLYLVDLAGSEKVSKTGAEGRRLSEAKNINRSLTMLGLVITALTDPKAAHIPYRDSKLTRILQDSLGGNSNTTLIVTCSPSPYNEKETVSTCRFGVRAKSIKNKPKVNREYTLAELKLMLSRAREEISLKNRTILALEKALGRSLTAMNLTVEDDEEETELNETKITEVYDGVISDLEEVRNKLEAEKARGRVLQRNAMELADENSELRSDQNFIRKQIEGLQAKLEMIQGNTRFKEEQIERLTAANSSLAKEIDNETPRKLNLELQMLKNELERSKAEMKIATNAVVEENALFKEDLQEEREKNDKLVRSLQEIEFNIKDLKDKTRVKEKNELEILKSSYDALRSRWHEEKRSMLKDLSLQIEKDAEIQRKINNSEQRFTQLQRSLKEGEKTSNEKFQSLQRNLEQLTLLYHQLVSKETDSNVEKKIAVKKIERVNKRITELEKEVKLSRSVISELRRQNELANVELKELKLFKSQQEEERVFLGNESRNFGNEDSNISYRNTISIVPNGGEINFSQNYRDSLEI